LLLLRRVAQGCDPTNIDAAMSADVLHDRFFLLLPGLAIDALFGEMPPLFALVPHPVVLAGRAVVLLDRKLNRHWVGRRTCSVAAASPAPASKPLPSAY